MLNFALKAHFRLVGNIECEKFLDYEYMFIYHLDCYIFYDNLEYWMNLNLPQVECVWDCIVNDVFITYYYNGEGLRNVRVFYDYLKDN